MVPSSKNFTSAAAPARLYDQGPIAAVIDVVARFGHRRNQTGAMVPASLRAGETGRQPKGEGT
jgi:hypothetical protein